MSVISWSPSLKSVVQHLKQADCNMSRVDTKIFASQQHPLTKTEQELVNSELFKSSSRTQEPSSWFFWG